MKADVDGRLTGKRRPWRKCRVRPNHIWSIWYCVLAVTAQVYLVHAGIDRFVALTHMPWTSGNQPYVELNVTVGLIGLSIIALPCFVVSSLCQIGNLANDGRKLGKGLEACSSQPGRVGLRLYHQAGLRALWQHGPPTAAFLHLFSSFCLLLPRLLLQARMIEQGLLDREFLWRTELDLILPHRDRLAVLGFLFGSNSTLLPSTGSSFLASVGGWRPSQAAELWTTHWGSLSPEFLNHAFAHAVYAVAYPAVFWHTSRVFALIFSVQLVANAAFSLLAFCGFSVLYKVQAVGCHALLDRGCAFLLSASMTTVLFVVSCAFTVFSSAIVYFFGYQRFAAFLHRERARRHILLAGGREDVAWAYWPHVTAFLVLLAWILSDGPLVYDWVVVYRGSLDAAALSAAVGALLHLFLWILVWFVFTARNSWRFELLVTVGRTHVWDAESVVLVNQVEMAHRAGGRTMPLLVVGDGKTYTVNDPTARRAILSLADSAAAAGAPPRRQEEDEEDAGGAAARWGDGRRVRLENVRLGSRWLMDASSGGSGGGGGGGRVTFREHPKTWSVRAYPRRGDSASCSPDAQQDEDEDDDDEEEEQQQQQQFGEYALLRRLKESPFHGAQRSEMQQLLPDGEILSPREEVLVPISRNCCAGPSPLYECFAAQQYDPTGLSPPDKTSTDGSETSRQGSDSSSGVFSQQSSECSGCPPRRATSIERLTDPPRAWKNLSLPRGAPPETVVIRRGPDLPLPAREEDPYGRRTNLRMTSFLDQTRFPPPPAPRECPQRDARDDVPVPMPTIHTAYPTPAAFAMSCGRTDGYRQQRSRHDVWGGGGACNTINVAWKASCPQPLLRSHFSTLPCAAVAHE